MSENKINKKSFLQKRIPTLLGLGFLIVALVAGTIMFGQGTGVFAPRATPQTTPKSIRVSNLTDSGFTVSFLTDETTTGHIKYGTEQNKINSQASDDRDQLSGTIEKYNLHHITVRGLDANTTYYYTLGTGSGAFDNNGQPFVITTARKSGVPSAAKTIYGSVVTPSGNPAEGTIVYAKVEGVGEMSSLVKSSGSWAIPLSNARMADGSTYAQIQDSDTLTLFIQGESASLTSQITVQVADAQPVSSVTLGQSQTSIAPSSNSSSSGNEIAQLAIDNELVEATDSSDSGGLNELVTSSPEASDSSSLISTIDLETLESASESPTVNTTQPKITGKAAPNATISIQVNSDTQIDQYIVADSEGNFELDISQLEQELEPGEHTITYSYEDPDTGQTVTKNQTFFVSETASLLAQANTEDEEEDYPYSSSNPYPMDASESAEASDSSDASDSASSTQSAIPVSGSVGTTYALIFGGFFFILAGVWSWWIASNLEEELVV